MSTQRIAVFGLTGLLMLAGLPTDDADARRKGLRQGADGRRRRAPAEEPRPRGLLHRRRRRVRPRDEGLADALGALEAPPRGRHRHPPRPARAAPLCPLRHPAPPCRHARPRRARPPVAPGSRRLRHLDRRRVRPAHEGRRHALGGLAQPSRERRRQSPRPERAEAHTPQPHAPAPPGRGHVLGSRGGASPISRRAPRTRCAVSSAPATESPRRRTSTAAATGAGTTPVTTARARLATCSITPGCLAGRHARRAASRTGASAATAVGDRLRQRRSHVPDGRRPPVRHDRPRARRHPLAPRHALYGGLRREAPWRHWLGL